jgi:hypothetical protein
MMDDDKSPRKEEEAQSHYGNEEGGRRWEVERAAKFDFN